MKKRAISLLMAVAMTIGLMPVGAAADTAEQGYYQSQLTSSDAREIYDTFSTMTLASGTETVELSSVQTADWDTLFADFVAARDAYMLDHNLFYVDFDKMTLSQEGTTVTMGIGREETYFHDGFDSGNVDGAISAFDGAVKSIAEAAAEEATLQEKVRAAYDAVIASTEYALEADAEPENVNYVRTPYGALVKGQAVCEGYSRALKAVLDEMGITNVLVQGTYDDGTYRGPHMWNYVCMDDNRWYMLDATMEDGLRSSTANLQTESFFMVTGIDPLMREYQPSGVVSLSSKSIEFNYPDLSIREYEDLSTAFTVTDGNISYKGNGVNKAQETCELDGEKIYVTSSYDGVSWYYYERYLQAMMVYMDHASDPTTVDILNLGLDGEESFPNTFTMAYFGVTTVAPTAEYETGKLDQYYKYEGGLSNVHEISAVDEAITFEKAPPHIVEKNPNTYRLDQNKTYNVTVYYSEELVEANYAAPVVLDWVEKVNDAEISNFKWWGEDANNPDSTKVTFTLKTGINFGRTTNYWLQVQGLIGIESRKAPNAISFSTYNYNTYDCPKVDWDVNKIHSNTPALIANEDLSTSGWTSNGEDLSNFPKKLSLVATTIEDGSSEKKEMLGEIEEITGTGAVLSAQTYDITLSLCSAQVDYITGDPVQVYVPFPAGYNADSVGVIFKAYHFDKDGKPEEIRCEVVKGGIIMYCDKFSPFAVVAMNADAVPETYAVSFNANGGTGEMENVENVSGAYALPDCTFTAPENKEFKGWAYTEDGEVITETTINVSGNITLYAIWGTAEHVHSGTLAAGWDADCKTETNGQKDYYECTCDVKFYDEACTDAVVSEDELVIPWEHTLSHKEKDAATCIAAGTVEHWECSVCGKLFSDSEGKAVITDTSTAKDPSNHASEEVCYIENDAETHKKLHKCCTVPITTEEHSFDNDEDMLCNECGYDRTHHHSVKLVSGWDADCKTETNGQKNYYECSCDVKFYDEDCSEVVVKDEDLVIPWAHIGGVATCKERAVCKTCGNSYGEVNADNHASDEFSYTNSGETHSKAHKCCGFVVSSSESHNYVDGECICGAKEQIEEPDDREYVVKEVEVDKTATATQNGLSVALTKDDIKVENEDIVSVTMSVSVKASNVKPWWGSWFGSSRKNTYDHSITFEGKNVGTTVVKVGDIYYKIIVKEAHTHEYTSVLTAPTCTEPGYVVYSCECGDKYRENLPANGHDYDENGVCHCGTVKPTSFAPKTFSVSISKSSVKVGRSANITVKTSTDVEYVMINGEKVDTYKICTSGWFFNKTTYREFTYRVKEYAAGNYKYEVYAYNVDDAQSETSHTVKLTVKEANNGWWN